MNGSIIERESSNKDLRERALVLAGAVFRVMVMGKQWKSSDDSARTGRDGICMHGLGLPCLISLIRMSEGKA
jgi:hypothetical protein